MYAWACSWATGGSGGETHREEERGDRNRVDIRNTVSVPPAAWSRAVPDTNLWRSRGREGGEPLAQLGQAKEFQTHIFAPPVMGAPRKKSKFVNASVGRGKLIFLCWFVRFFSLLFLPTLFPS